MDTGNGGFCSQFLGSLTLENAIRPHWLVKGVFIILDQYSASLDLKYF